MSTIIPPPSSTDIYQPPLPAYNIARTHGSLMVMSWIWLASNGILMARHFRTIRVGGKQRLCGEAIWFQAHRLFMWLAAFLTLLAFLFIYTFAGATWISLADSGQKAFGASQL
ncbi:unnamed protein product [Didymodactylos carnosus]|uniref:Cytochrome b561 domain-containing protein n=1 Tax=Didymodactylos carnosus TaxID=1234261 RepID=A0A8S2DDV9_9BILA|nr:unnamed protein product [Didymodactylos carnosus]CAF3656065.1 unnamed protein product [Didymodactylos carnosus]